MITYKSPILSQRQRPRRDDRPISRAMVRDSSKYSSASSWLAEIVVRLTEVGLDRALCSPCPLFHDRYPEPACSSLQPWQTALFPNSGFRGHSRPDASPLAYPQLRVDCQSLLAIFNGAGILTQFGHARAKVAKPGPFAPAIFVLSCQAQRLFVATDRLLDVVPFESTPSRGRPRCSARARDR